MCELLKKISDLTKEAATQHRDVAEILDFLAICLEAKVEGRPKYLADLHSTIIRLATENLLSALIKRGQ